MGNFINKKVRCLFLMVIISTTTQAGVFAQGANEKYLKIIKSIRCPVCQSQSLAESETMESKLLRQEIHEWVTKGISEKDINEKVASRYGKDKLLTPNLEKKNWFLWTLPYLLAFWCCYGINRKKIKR